MLRRSILLRRFPQRNSSSVRENAGIQQKKQMTNDKRRRLGKLATLLSFLCSAIALGLLAGSSFGPKNIFDNEIVYRACNCVHGILTASVLLAIVAMILSASRCDVKRVDIVNPNPYLSLNRSTKRDPEATIERSNKHSNLPANVNKTATYQCKSKKEDSKVKKNTEVSAKKYNSTSSQFQQREKEDILPVNPHPKLNPPCFEKALVPYQGNQNKLNNHVEGVPSFDNSSLVRPSSDLRLNSTEAPRRETLTEFIASRRMRYFPEKGKIQAEDEFKIKRITNFYPVPNFKGSSKEFCKRFVNPSAPGPFIPRGDHVSEMISKMEGLQFFY